MFRCSQCHTEYGGIRGIAPGSCPRCRAQSPLATRPRSGPSPVTMRLEPVRTLARLDKLAHH
jgi:hypothetical protein